MSTHAHRAVHDPPPAPQAQEKGHLVEQDREVSPGLPTPAFGAGTRRAQTPMLLIFSKSERSSG
jgi:hypothetical protein